MTTVKTSATGSKRRRGSEKSARKFDVKDAAKKTISKKKQLPSPAAYPRKAKRGNGLFRLMVIAAMCFVLLSTISSWRARMARRRLRMQSQSSDQHHFFSFRKPVSGGDIEIAEDKDGKNHEADTGSSDGNLSNTHHMTDESSHQDSTHVKDSKADSLRRVDGIFSDSDRTTAAGHEEQQLSFEELPERIEWYTRDDYKDGSRPMCRISNLYLISNGTILLPEWMSKYEKLLQRCGISAHSFYSTAVGPEGLERTRDIDADFVLTIHPEKFQEPTNVPSIYLTEHILKASYLFDVFGGNARPAEGVREHHCYTTANDSECSLPRPAKTLLKPAIFVPKRIEVAPQDSWTRRLVDMFGLAHGHGHDATHLNVSTMLYQSHEGKSEQLIGTRFRSIMTTDGMFRHLPANGLLHSSFYSTKNGISKASKERAAGSPCQVSVGIANSGDATSGIDGVSDLKDKIEAVGRLAVPDAEIETKLIEFRSRGGLEEHIKEMQELDVYIGGSGDQMSSIGYLRSTSAAVELMPFGVKPNTHESLARALGIQYVCLAGKPQVEDFKRCIEGEVFNMRKKGKLAFTETPEWQESLMKAWDDAVGQFVLSGTSSLDLLTAEEPIRNYHSKVCALKQKIEVGLDDVARKVALVIKEKCTST